MLLPVSASIWRERAATPPPHPSLRPSTIQGKARPWDQYTRSVGSYHPRRMVSAAAVRQRVRALLESADLEHTTERKIREALAQEIGADEVKKHQSTVKKAVEEFLNEAAGAEDDDGDFKPGQEEDSEDDFSAEEEGGKGGKRKGSSSGAAKPKKKQAREEDANELVIPLGTRKRVSVRAFKGRVLVDLRETWEKDGEDLPTAKGVALSVAQWRALSGALDQLIAAQMRADTGFTLQLSDARKAYTSEFKGKVSVQVREFFQSDDGEWKPTKRGLSLDADALASLKKAVQRVDAQVTKLGGDAQAQEPVPAAAGRGSKAAAGGKAAAAEGGAGSGAGAGREGPCVELGGGKKATISNFRGGTMVDLREWYSKDGTWMPGKKGISLKVDDWQKVCGAVGAIDAAVRSRDTRYSLPLSSKRKCTISEFKGKLYVGIREYYEKNGEELPGQKGISLACPDQWGALKNGIEQINAALQ